MICSQTCIPTPTFTWNIFFLPFTISHICSFAHTYIYATAHEVTHPHTCAHVKCTLTVWENVRVFLHSIINTFIVEWCSVSRLISPSRTDNEKLTMLMNDLIQFDKSCAIKLLDSAGAH